MGVIPYELITGALPFMGDNPGSFRQHPSRIRLLRQRAATRGAAWP